MVKIPKSSKCIYLYYYMIFIVKRASGNEHFISALAKINDKLNVIEKSIKPVSDDETAEIPEDLDSLPLTSLEQLHAFEKVLKTDKNIYKKLVRIIKN